MSSARLSQAELKDNKEQVSFTLDLRAYWQDQAS